MDTHKEYFICFHSVHGRSKAQLLLLALMVQKLNYQVGFKPVSHFVSVVNGLCGTTENKIRLGAELKDSADGIKL